MGAMVMRLALLASIAWVVKLTNPLFTVFGQEISFRDLILLLGGLFLIWKASKEIHESIEGLSLIHISVEANAVNKAAELLFVLGA